MNVKIKRIEECTFASLPAVIAIGNFDGLHRGHQDVISTAVRMANEKNATAVAITFSSSPLKMIAPDKFMGDIITLEEKILYLEELGINEILLLKSSIELLSLSPHDFLNKIAANYQIKGIVVGENFKFGKNASGDTELLKKFAYSRQAEMISIPLKTNDEKNDVISSTYIRKCIAEGKMRDVMSALGRYWSVTGIIESGASRGKQIGFPTANLCLEKERILPRKGVYVSCVRYNGVLYPAVTNVGINPTFDGTITRIETHILDFDKPIYGEKISVYFISYLRSEKKFPGVDALKKQISSDIVQARKILQNEARFDKCR